MADIIRSESLGADAGPIVRRLAQRFGELPQVVAVVLAGSHGAGRFDFGVGVGWLAEEFAAVGVPWERRADRTREYLKAMQMLWTEEEPEFKGEFCSFPKGLLVPETSAKAAPADYFWRRERAGSQAGG